MTTAYQRIPISESIGFSEILDPKFKTNSLMLCFFQPLSSKTASACALAGDLITSSSKAYPTNAVMSQKLHLLYGAGLSCSVKKQGDLQNLTINASAIADRYALEGEAVFQELVEILLDCLLQPNVTDGAFDADEFHIGQNNLLDNIDAEINDKRQYALRQARVTAFQNEPAAISCYGTHEEAASLTPASVYTAYQELLRTAKIEIFFVGPESKPELPQKFRDAFATVQNRTVPPISFSAPSPVKAEPVTIREVLPVNQCKMVMAWKTDCADLYATKMAAFILGGTPSSKLFSNVREKMSLCYYCAASYSETKQTMLVDCGIETENIQKTRDAISAQLEALRQGDISDEEMQSALMYVHNTMRGVGDTAGSYISWYLGQFCRGSQLSTAEEEAIYSKITKEQIVTAAKAMQLDTIYIMECKEQEEQHGNH